MILIPKSKISQRSYPPELKQEVYYEPIISNEEEAPMKSSCIAPSDGGVEAAKEKDERAILDEPMVAKALELFSPKKVRVKRKN